MLKIYIKLYLWWYVPCKTLIGHYMKLQWVKFNCFVLKYLLKLCILLIRSCASFGAVKCCHGNTYWGAKKYTLNLECMIILPIVWVENTIENVDWIVTKTTDQSHLVIIVLIMLNKCLQTDVAHNSVDRLHTELHTRTN